MSQNIKTASVPAPLYVQFAQALKQKIAEMGLEFEESEGTETGFPQNEGYFFVRSAPGLAAMIVPKSKTRMGNVHLHIDASDLEGWVPLPKKNGKVIGHFVPDLDLLTPVLAMLPGRAKRPTIVASRAPVSATPKAPVTGPMTDVFGEALTNMLLDSQLEGSFATAEESEAELATVSA